MDYLRLSKETSYALRHKPEEYRLRLDEEGYVDIDSLLSALDATGHYERKLTKEDLEKMIEASEKKRHEIKGDKIRAYYGHSLHNRIKKEEIIPPAILYHGTTHTALPKILATGLKPMGRQYVHLSVDKETAIMVGKRRDEEPLVLKIDAKKAHEDGLRFYEGNDKVVLADFIDPIYISLDK